MAQLLETIRKFFNSLWCRKITSEPWYSEFEIDFPPYSEEYIYAVGDVNGTFAANYKFTESYPDVYSSRRQIVNFDLIPVVFYYNTC